MNLYLLSQTQNNDYDTYDSCVVASEDRDSAKKINPCNSEWGYRFSAWCSSPEHVTVEYLGVAKEGTQEGIIISSFNAG